jgi:polyisoprenoid-binding protein YceI
MKTILFIFLSALLITNVKIFAQSKTLEAIKKESSIMYFLTHPLHKIEAVTKDDECKIEVDESQKEIKQVDVKVDVTTFDSGNSNRDSHAMEVVDAISYPDADFTSSEIKRNGDSLKVKGKLTFHGVTKDIYISAFQKWTEKKLEIRGNFDISLTAFKIERPSLLLIPVNDNLHFSLVQIFFL